jgi:hypothetical protein
MSPVPKLNCSMPWNGRTATTFGSRPARRLGSLRTELVFGEWTAERLPALLRLGSG